MSFLETFADDWARAASVALQAGVGVWLQSALLLTL